MKKIRADIHPDNNEVLVLKTNNSIITLRENELHQLIAELEIQASQIEKNRINNELNEKQKELIQKRINKFKTCIECLENKISKIK